MRDGERGGVGRGEGKRGRSRRRFDSAELSLVLLHLMQEQPRYGYDLIREIETRTGGAYAPSPGTVYPTLTMLEELGQIEAGSADQAKRVFVLTDAGRSRLAAHKTETERAWEHLDAFRTEAGHIDAGPVFRAMQNLKTVLEQRLGGPQDKQMLFDVADCIDEAARKIERLG